MRSFALGAAAGTIGVRAFPTQTHTFEPVKSWPIEDALLTRRVIEGLFESARSGQWRTLTP